MKNSPAYTLIEVLIAIVVLAIVTIPGFFIFFRSQANQRLAASAEIFSNHLRQARTFSRDSRDGMQWGIKAELDSSNYDLISRQDPSEPTTTKNSFKLQDGITFNTNFTVIFEKLTGDMALGTLPIELKNKFGKKHTLMVYQTGVIEITPN